MQLQSLLLAFREAGVFVAVSIGLPFAFEGKKRRTSAENLLSWLGNAANFVAIVEQVSIKGRAYICCLLQFMLNHMLLSCRTSF